MTKKLRKPAEKFNACIIDQITVVLQLVQNSRKSALSPSPVDFRPVLKHSQAEVVRASLNHSININFDVILKGND